VEELSNGQIAERLLDVGRLLEQQGANPFRVAAYRRAAEVVRGFDRPAAEMVRTGGPEALAELPGIGQSLARSIERLALTGRLGLLDRLLGSSQPERVLATVPTIGPILAERLHGELQVESLEELEEAAWDGRLAKLHGFGAKRLRAVRESLAGRFRRPAAPATVTAPAASTAPAAITAPTAITAQQDVAAPEPAAAPSIAELLDVDAEYREKARRGRLPRVAPRRFNPTRAAWLPILHTERSGRHYTALFSNTVRAHELGATSDWVVIYRDDGDGHGQWTVVTARYGSLRGRRIVRGREAECAEHYRQRAG
jgi:DNA polymerase (family 10)